MNFLLLLNLLIVSTFCLNFGDGASICKSSIFYEKDCGICVCSRDGRSVTCADTRKTCDSKKVQPEDELPYENSLLRLKIKKILEEETRKRDNCQGRCINPHSQESHGRSESRSSESRSSGSGSSESGSSESGSSKSDNSGSDSSESNSSGSSEGSSTSESGSSESGSSESGSSESDSSETHRRRGRPNRRPRPRCCYGRRSWDCAYRSDWRC